MAPLLAGLFAFMQARKACAKMTLSRWWGCV